MLVQKISWMGLGTLMVALPFINAALSRWLGWERIDEGD